MDSLLDLNLIECLLNLIPVSNTDWSYCSNRIMHNNSTWISDYTSVDFASIVLTATSLVARTPVRTWAVEKTAHGARQEVMAKEPSSPPPFWRAGSDELSLCSSNRYVFVPWRWTDLRRPPCFRANPCVSLVILCAP